MHSLPINVTSSRNWVATKLPMLICCLLLAISLGLSSKQAQAELSEKSEAIPMMDTMTITYRNAFDYALYQQTTELLSAFHHQHEQHIMLDARSQSKIMAADFGISVAVSTPLAEKTKSLHNQGLLVAPQ